MNRLFLDANILFSAAYRPQSRIRELWTLPDTLLLTSDYALTEARRNLQKDHQFERLDTLLRDVDVVPSTFAPPPEGVDLPEKDWPILQAAIGCQATHLITGDLRHFGPLFGKTVSGVRIITASTFLNES